MTIETLTDSAREALRAAGNRKVRAVVRAESAAAYAIYDLAAGTYGLLESGSDPGSWRAVLRELDACTLSVNDWLLLH